MKLETVSRTVQFVRMTRMFGAILLTLVVVASPLISAASSDDGHGFDHVFIIMMENTGYDTLRRGSPTSWTSASSRPT
jgi:hypothetical protein